MDNKVPPHSTILFCWELGGGLGHMMQMLPLAEDLAKAGCRVFIALRQLEKATSIYGRVGVMFLQAPLWIGGPSRFSRPISYAPMLMNVGFGNDGELWARACAWRNLMRLVRPDLMVFDHSPTALLASRGLAARRALIGSGFCCPPDVPKGETWGLLRGEAAGKIDPARLHAPQEELLSRMNRVLERWKQPPMERLGQLYKDVDVNFLTTFPELDHFGARENVGYWGQVACSGGDEPQWPSTPGKRVFAYLKKFKGLGDLLGHLQKRAAPTIVYVDGLDKSLARFECQTLRFARRRLDIVRVSRECDLAILNSGHGATAEMLLAGKPILELPLAFEQRMIADAVKRIGAGELSSIRDLQSVTKKLDLMLKSDQFAAQARQFSEKYNAFDSSHQRQTMNLAARDLLASNEIESDYARIGRMTSPCTSVSRR